jgi:uncharacterized protein YbjT (DUF2867 family)
MSLPKPLQDGHTVRALVRGRAGARGTDILVGDLTRAETLGPALEGVDAIVFTHGSNGAGRVGAETVDYGGVRNFLAALGGRKARIELMTAIGITNRASSYNRSSEAYDWKRRDERLVRASGNPYTIVRPGWFDYNAAGQHRIVLLQGDTRSTGTPTDGAIARSLIAEVLLHSLTSEAARQFELIAETGPTTAPGEFDALFASVRRSAGRARWCW